jgi:hypothetical protein
MCCSTSRRFVINVVLCVSLTAFASCTAERIVFHGRIETYAGIDLKNKVIEYGFSNKEGVIARGKARIGHKGEFTIRVRKTWKTDYALIVWCFENMPETHFCAGSRGFSDDGVHTHDLGNIYWYDDLIVTGIPKGSTRLDDLSLKVSTNIPDIDHYEGRLYSPRHIDPFTFSFKGPNFTLKDADDALAKAGSTQVVGGRIIAENRKPEGECVLFINAVRIVNGQPNTVSSSGWLILRVANRSQ